MVSYTDLVAIVFNVNIILEQENMPFELKYLHFSILSCRKY